MSSTELHYFYHHLGILYKKKNTLLSCNYQAKWSNFPNSPTDAFIVFFETRKTFETFIVFFLFLKLVSFFETRIQSRLMHYMCLISFVIFKPEQPHKHTVFFLNPCDMGILKKLEQSPYKITTFLMHCLLQHYLTCSYVSCIPCILKL